MTCLGCGWAGYAHRHNDAEDGPRSECCAHTCSCESCGMPAAIHLPADECEAHGIDAGLRDGLGCAIWVAGQVVRALLWAGDREPSGWNYNATQCAAFGCRNLVTPTRYRCATHY